MITPRFVVVVATALLAAWSGAAQGASPADCPGHSLARYDEARSYREPDLPPAPFQAVDPERDGVHLQVDFPHAARGGEERLTYWLTGDEPIELDIQMALGRPTGDAYRARSVRSLLTVDGIQVPFRPAGSGTPRWSADHTLVPGQVSRFRLVIPPAAIAHGAHAVTLVNVTPTGERFPSWSFTALKDGTGFAARRPVGGGAIGPRSDAWASGLTLPGALRTASGEVDPPAGGRLAARIAVQPSFPGCPETVRGFAVLAFLDGVQVPLGSLGLAPHLNLPYGQRFEADVEFRGLPVDGETHVLAVFAVADGVHMEAPADEISVEAELPRQIGRFWWKSSGD